MGKPTNIRNVTVIQCEHMSSSESNSISCVLGKNSITAGSLVHREFTGCNDGCVISNPSCLSVYYELSDEDLTHFAQEREGTGFLINLIDSPYPVDHSNGNTTNLCVTDGAVITVDCSRGVSCKTVYILRQALTERLKPVVLLSGMYKVLLELQENPEGLYQMFNEIVENINDIIHTYSEKNGPMEEVTVTPVEGSVIFGSACQNWAFSIQRFAEIYSEKFNIDVCKLTKRLWGDHFYNAKEKKWTKTSVGGCVRGFHQFILDPIIKVFDAILNFKREETNKLLEKLSINLSASEELLMGKPLLKAVMVKWLPIADTLLRMITVHLPSPVTAQKYRMELLYEGPHDDPCALGIKSCDPKAPLMMCVSKMIPTSDQSRLYSFGRVFSGVISSGVRVRIMDHNYVHGKQEDLHIKPIESVLFLMGRYVEPIQDVPCGNIIGLTGVDHFLVNTGTITTYQHAHSIKVMKTRVSPVVSVTVEAKYPSELPRLVKQLKDLAQCDPMVRCTVNKSGKHVIAGVSELHLERCFWWKNDTSHISEQVHKSDPMVFYRETVSEESSQVCLSKSPNEKSRLYMKACPFPEGLSEDIDKGEISHKQEPNERAHYLVEKYKYDARDAHKIWCFGPEGIGPNILIDCTKGVKNLDEIRSAVVAGFQWATEQCREYDLSGIYRVINARQGQIFDVHQLSFPQTLTVKAYLPVCESFGVIADIGSSTKGQAFVQCIVDHWRLLSDDPFDTTSRSARIIADVRKHKGLNVKIPGSSEFLDK